MKYIEAIYDCDTDTETIVEREFTKEELARQQEFKTKLENDAKRELEKAALLTKLGISAEEAKLLLS
jgi:hypothetical protein